MSKLFILSHSYYEESTNYYLMGPDNVSEEEFSELCYSLLDDAARLALSSSRQSEFNDKIRLDNVVESLIPLLKEQGYQRFTPPKANFFGNPLTVKEKFMKNFSTSISNEIINYNRAFDRKYKL